MVIEIISQLKDFMKEMKVVKECNIEADLKEKIIDETGHSFIEVYIMES